MLDARAKEANARLAKTKRGLNAVRHDLTETRTRADAKKSVAELEKNQAEHGGELPQEISGDAIARMRSGSKPYYSNKSQRDG